VKTHTGENLLCFGWIYNLYLFSYTRIGDFTWRVSDCEELVGGSHRIWWGLFHLVSVNSNHFLVKILQKCY